jgi:predicted DNA-binding transcriptional regulator YafY
VSESKGKGSAKAGRASASADDATRGDRSKRLLDLVMILLRARTPVTFREIRDLFPAYKTTNVEAGLRAFERDKADLLELGVPVRYITPEEDDALEDGGYTIDFKRFRLPEVRLTTDEVSALVLAASVARAMPGGAYPKIVDLALKKLAFDLPELPDTPTEFPRVTERRAGAGHAAGAHDDPLGTVLVHFPEQRAAVRGPSHETLSEHFATLEAAIRFRKRVALGYHNAASGDLTQRDVDAYALVFRDGAWLLVGHCHLRQDVRSFRVDRIATAVMAPKPKSPDFERPAEFDVRAYVQRSPWTFATEAPELVELSIGPQAADIANEDFGPGAERTTVGDQTIIRFACANPDFAASRVLAAKGAIAVRLGARLIARIAAELDAVAAHYAPEGIAS